MSDTAILQPEPVHDDLPPLPPFPLNKGFRPAAQILTVHTKGRFLVEQATGRVVRSMGISFVAQGKDSDEDVIVLAVENANGTRDPIILQQAFRPPVVPALAKLNFNIMQKLAKPR